MKKLNSFQVVTASSLTAGAMLAALIQTLIRKEIISDEEGHEIYEQALLMLELAGPIFFARCVRGRPGDDRATPSKTLSLNGRPQQ
jgi:hypothetical protein